MFTELAVMLPVIFTLAEFSTVNANRGIEPILNAVLLITVIFNSGLQ
jgi:hypothetical protein